MGLLDGISSGIGNLYDRAKSTANDAIDTVEKKVDTVETKVADTAKEVVKGWTPGAAVAGLPPAATKAVTTSDGFETVKNAAKKAAGWVGTAAEKAAPIALAAIPGIGPAAAVLSTAKGREAVAAGGAFVSEKMEGAQEGINKKVDSAEKATQIENGGPVGGYVNVQKNIAGGLVKGVTGMVTGVVGLAGKGAHLADAKYRGEVADTVGTIAKNPGAAASAIGNSFVKAVKE